ncbi:hypothetical protein [Leptolyngbya sp. Cla-17]
MTGAGGVAIALDSLPPSSSVETASIPDA